MATFEDGIELCTGLFFFFLHLGHSFNLGSFKEVKAAKLGVPGEMWVRAVWQGNFLILSLQS